MPNETNTPEPLSAILAEMRRANLQPPFYQRCVDEYADRIEAAAKRGREAARSARDTRDAMDCATTAARPFVGVDLAKDGPTYTCVELAPGNAAAMREALEKIARWDDGIGADISNIARAALDAPPRNCDVGTTEEQAERFKKFCLDHQALWHGCTNCPELMSEKCAIAWAQMPFAPAEGVAK